MKDVIIAEGPLTLSGKRGRPSSCEGSSRTALLLEVRPAVSMFQVMLNYFSGFVVFLFGCLFFVFFPLLLLVLLGCRYIYSVYYFSDYTVGSNDTTLC